MHNASTLLYFALPVPNSFALSHERTRFSVKRFWKNCVFPFLSTNSVGMFSHSGKNSERYYYKCTCVCIYSTGNFWQILFTNEFSPQFFKAFLQFYFIIHPVGTVFCIGSVDGRTENTRKHEKFSIFADLREINMAAWLISMSMFFWRLQISSVELKPLRLNFKFMGLCKMGTYLMNILCIYFPSWRIYSLSHSVEQSIIRRLQTRNFFLARVYETKRITSWQMGNVLN
jgi:hypothetical protein